MKKNTLTIATCQYDISGNLQENLSVILRQIKEAKSQEAMIAHFPECCLTGYGGIDLPEIHYQDYVEVQNTLEKIKEAARSLGIQVIIGAHHYANETQIRPFNSLYLINSYGEIETRYDKRILTGTDGSMDHAHYSAGDKPIVFNLNGIKCGMLICHEWRYPELYREYKKLGVELLFQSWYDGGLNQSEYEAEGIHTGELIVGTAKGYAANNYIWISGSNTSSTESCFPSFVIRPDGRIHKQLERNSPGVLVSHLDLNEKFEDPSFYGRKRFL